MIASRIHSFNSWMYLPFSFLLSFFLPHPRSPDYPLSHHTLARPLGSSPQAVVLAPLTHRKPHRTFAAKNITSHSAFLPPTIHILRLPDDNHPPPTSTSRWNSCLVWSVCITFTYPCNTSVTQGISSCSKLPIPATWTTIQNIGGACLRAPVGSILELLSLCLIRGSVNCNWIVLSERVHR